MSKMSTKLYWIPVFIIFVLYGVVFVHGGCEVARRCCAGKDNTCKAYGRRFDYVNNSTTYKICFCDSNCIQAGDCCDDYTTYCKASDCKVGDWEPWGECSSQCESGTKSRKRPVLEPARNGGKECPPLLEQTRCIGENCVIARNIYSYATELKETAKIIPAVYGSYRIDKKYDPYKDIRKNLFFYYASNQIIERPPYCATFEILRSDSGCIASESLGWPKTLREGQLVCVECQQLAMKHKIGLRCRGHGVYMQESRWHAVTLSGCHGKWRMITQHQECTCNPDSDHSYILI